MEEHTHWLPKDEYEKKIAGQATFFHQLIEKLSKVRLEDLEGMSAKEKLKHIYSLGRIGFDQITLLKMCSVLADEIDSLKQEITELKQQLNK
jgi:hypothetical protein